MRGYQTEQKKLLLLYLSAHADEAFSTAALCDALGECGIGQSTVYRLIARLYAEGAVRRFAEEGGRGYLYQYLAVNECATHLHLRCTVCGRLIHLDGEESRLLEELICRKKGFSLDEGQTMLLGTCRACHIGGGVPPSTAGADGTEDAPAVAGANETQDATAAATADNTATASAADATAAATVGEAGKTAARCNK